MVVATTTSEEVGQMAVEANTVGTTEVRPRTVRTTALLSKPHNAGWADEHFGVEETKPYGTSTKTDEPEKVGSQATTLDSKVGITQLQVPRQSSTAQAQHQPHEKWVHRTVEAAVAPSVRFSVREVTTS